MAHFVSPAFRSHVKTLQERLPSPKIIKEMGFIRRITSSSSSILHSSRPHGTQLHTHSTTAHTHQCDCKKAADASNALRASLLTPITVLCVLSFCLHAVLYVMPGNFQPLRGKLFWVVVSSKVLVEWDKNKTAPDARLLSPWQQPACLSRRLASNQRAC